MSNILKLNSSDKLKIKILGMDGGAYAVTEDKQDQMQLQIHNAYEQGFREGHKKAFDELENRYNTKLETINNNVSFVLNGIDEKIKSYEENFDLIVLELSFVIAEKIIRDKIEQDSTINKILGESIKKVLGANNVIVKLNEKDLASLNSENKSIVNSGSYSKIKFEVDDSIEPGGCLIETDIGNVDGRISAQINELKKQISYQIQVNDKEDAN